MKHVILAEPTDDFDPKALVQAIIGQAPAQNQAGNTIEQWSKRLRILDAIREGDATSFTLEDEDYNLMKDIIEGFSGFAGGENGKNIPRLVQMRDDIRAAKKPVKKEEAA